ncbi:MAG: ZIP family metal transporter [Gammaproteobacteria bacterium]|nr:MAG: ZIP family metal transporter [Gammaproteobacteria bacterium]
MSSYQNENEQDYRVTLTIYKAIAALFIFFISIVTAAYPLKKKHSLSHTGSFILGEALASGIFLGAAFLHMLPDSIRMIGEVAPTLSFPLPEAVCAGAFLFMLFLEQLSEINTALRSKNSIPYIVALILIIHALVEGAALGIGETFSEASMIFIAIIAHKGSESFALSVMLLRHKLPVRLIWLMIIFFSFMTPLGISFGTAIDLLALAGNGKLVAALFDAFAAGTFFYISTLHHIRFHHHTEDKQSLQEFACLVLGLVAMGIVALWN